MIGLGLQEKALEATMATPLPVLTSMPASEFRGQRIECLGGDVSSEDFHHPQLFVGF